LHLQFTSQFMNCSAHVVHFLIKVFFLFSHTRIKFFALNFKKIFNWCHSFIKFTFSWTILVKVSVNSLLCHLKLRIDWILHLVNLFIEWSLLVYDHSIELIEFFLKWDVNIFVIVRLLLVCKLVSLFLFLNLFFKFWYILGQWLIMSRLIV